MAEAYISRRRQVGLAVETTKGTEVVPTDFSVLAYDIQVATQVGRFDRDAQKARLSKLPGLVGTQACQISFNVEVRQTAAVDSFDSWNTALQGCGFVYNTTDNTWKPTSNLSDQKSLTIYVALGAQGGGGAEAKIFKAKGCMGNVSFDGKIGQPLIARFTFTGVMIGTADGALAFPTFESGVPSCFQGVSFTWGGVSRVLSSMTFDLGNTVVLRENINSGTGLVSAIITDRRPTGSIDPDLELNATDNDYGALVGNDNKALSFAVATGARNWNFSLPYCRVTNVNDVNRNGIQCAGLDFEICDADDIATPDGDVIITVS